MNARPGVRSSPLIRMATAARRPSRWWIAWLIALVIIHFVGPLGTWVGLLVLGDPASTSAWFPYVDAFTALAVLLALYLWVRPKEGRPFSTVGFQPLSASIRLLPGFGIGIGLASAVVGLGLLVDDLEVGRSVHPITGVAAVPALLPLAALALLTSGSAQAISNGYMLQMGARQMAWWVAVLSTSTIVAMQQTLNLVTLLNLVLFGVLTGLIALQQGSLWLAVGLQAGWYYTQDTILGLSRAGIADPVALWSVGPATAGSTVLSGGRFGLTAGLLASAVLVGAGAVAYVALRRTRRAVPSTPRALSSDPSG